MHRKLTRGLLQIAGLVALLAFSFATANAQVTTGKVRGLVLDQTGAVVPGAKVTIQSKSTNATATATTSGKGEYQFNDLLPGEYQVTVEAPSFRSVTLNDVRVADYTDPDPAPQFLQKGVIGLQTYGAEGHAGWVKFRNVRIREFP